MAQFPEAPSNMIEKETFQLSKNFFTQFSTHAGRKLYKCYQCDKLFGRLSTLKEHQQTHFGKKYLTCDQFITIESAM